MICPYCKKEAEFLEDSASVYGSNYGPLWVCRPCDARVGCHRGTPLPLGTLANDELRRKRRYAHSIFDPIWRLRRKSRREAYESLAKGLAIDLKDCHIGHFDLPRCLAAIKVIRKIRLSLGMDGGVQ